MYFVTGASKDLELFEITSCITHNRSIETRAALLKRDDVIGCDRTVRYFNCTEVPNESELDELLQEYTNGIKHTEDSRYFLFIPVTEVKTITKPIYVVTRRKGDGFGPWQLYMLKKTNRGVTRNPEEAYQTDKEGDALRKANSINDYYVKNKWPNADYRVMTLEEAIAKMQEDNNTY